MAVRAGAYGYFMSVPWATVFDGDADSVEDVLEVRDPELMQDPFEGWLEPGL